MEVEVKISGYLSVEMLYLVLLVLMVEVSFQIHQLILVLQEKKLLKMRVLLQLCCIADLFLVRLLVGQVLLGLVFLLRFQEVLIILQK